MQLWPFSTKYYCITIMSAISYMIDFELNKDVLVHEKFYFAF